MTGSPLILLPRYFPSPLVLVGESRGVCYDYINEVFKVPS